MTFTQPGSQNRLDIFTSVLSKTIVQQQQWSKKLKESRIFSSPFTDRIKQNVSHLFGKLRTIKFSSCSAFMSFTFNPNTCPSLSRRLASPQRSLSHLDLPGRALLHCLHHAPVRHLPGPIRRYPQPHRAQPLQLQNQSHDEDRRCLDHIHRWEGVISRFVSTRTHANFNRAHSLAPDLPDDIQRGGVYASSCSPRPGSIFISPQLPRRLFAASPPLHRWWFTSLCTSEKVALLLSI